VAAGNGARLLQGKKVIELVPQALPDKGSAIGKLIDQHGIKGLVYMGDDLSDVAVFDEVARRRSEGGVSALTLAVIDDETEDEVRRGADLELSGVAEVEAFLLALRRSLSREED
jgi:trehalose-phosphatase